MLLKISISYFMRFMYKCIILNFGVILFINKEMVSFCSTAHLYVWPSVHTLVRCPFCINDLPQGSQKLGVHLWSTVRNELFIK